MRKLDTATGFAKITKVPHTKLLQLQIVMPPKKIERTRAAPGQHVYLSIPPDKTSIHDLLFNPFTIVSVSSQEITLVLRALDGPTTKALDSLAKFSKARPPINIEGPYGVSQRFPNLAADYDRILLVAGGVGATFTLPIYRYLREQLETEAKSPDRLTHIWSMRSAAESSWAANLDCEEENLLEDDENIKIFITRGINDNATYEERGGSIELEDLQAVQEPVNPSGGRGRPDLKKIAEEVFRGGIEERVAVLVCGPKGMAKELRAHVGKYVQVGREVWWHNEAFGW
ncbi:hypothetical protein B7494_g4053 [Chlorociboria aeruginascens]|nr:hypothetical protein B7494_g4053 [Chlorociboria aeruginascens]